MWFHTIKLNAFVRLTGVRFRNGYICILRTIRRMNSRSVWKFRHQRNISTFKHSRGNNQHSSRM